MSVRSTGETGVVIFDNTDAEIRLDGVSGSNPAVGYLPVSLRGKGTNPGDTPLLLTPAGRMQIATGAQNFGDGQSGPTFLNGATDGQFPLGVMQYFWNGATADRDRTPSKFVDIPAVAITAGSPVTIWTPTAGKKFRLMGWALYTSTSSAFIFMDNAGILWRIQQLSTQNPNLTPGGFDNGYLSQAANNPFKLDMTVGATINGFVFGTEE